MLPCVRCCVFVVMLLLVHPAGSLAAVEHPFLLWTPAEAERIRASIATEDWASARWQGMDTSGRHDGFGRLFAYSVMQDEQAGAAIKKEMLGFIGARVDDRPWSSMYFSALRYDVIQHELSEAERARVRETFERHIDHEIHKDDRRYTRTSWLPNMQWPRKMGAMLMAVVLQDEARIKALVEANGGWAYYFDDYVSDGYFYNEEFGKQGSTIGTMLLWCRGCERLGLDQYGYGFVGRDGATMRRYLYSYILQGLPRYDLGHERYHYPRLTMGDAKGKGRNGLDGYGFQHALVEGHVPQVNQGQTAWYGSNMNGRDHKNRIVRKMLFPMWFEIAHQRWPEDGYGYFLAQMRRADEDNYIPSLYWGLSPIDPATVAPPAIGSANWPERGFSVLRAEQGTGFWESSAPAVGIRWATPYVHQVHDCFSLLQFVAFNRPLYVNRQVSGGYAGVDSGWSASIRSHAGVMVDYQEPRRMGEIPLRGTFGELAQFSAGTATGVYGEVTQTRALVLTSAYLFDVFHLRSPRPRQYLWTLQGLGQACPHAPQRWAPSQHLIGALPDVSEEQSRVVDAADWGLCMYQLGGGADERFSALGERWFDQRVGVDLRMLGAPTTIAYTAWTPGQPGDLHRLLHGKAEPGGRLVAVARSSKETTFVALHEPFQDGPKLQRFERLQETERAVAVRITGPEVDDRIAVAWDAIDEVQTLGSDEQLSFTSYVFLRIGAERIEVEGSLQGCRLRIPGAETRQLIVDGQPQPMTRVGDYLQWGTVTGEAAAAGAGTDAASQPLVAARWSREDLRIGTGAQGLVELELRNLGQAPAAGTVRIVPTAGLSVSPAEIDLAGLAPGQLRSVSVQVVGEAEASNRPGNLRLDGGERVQAAVLPVSQGMVIEHVRRWPGRPGRVVSGPRYRAIYYARSSVAADQLLDPDGELRTLYNRRERPRTPRLFPTEVDRKSGKSRLSSRSTPIKGFGYWAMAMRGGGKNGGLKTVTASGTHPHSVEKAQLVWRWTEQWMVASLRGAGDSPYRLDWFVTPHRGPATGLAEELQPLMQLHDGEQVHVLSADKRAKQPLSSGAAVVAAFRRPRGYRYGEAQFYAAGARFVGVDDKNGVPLVSQTGAVPTAFTYCLAEEFSELVEQWLEHGPEAEPKAWTQGSMNHGR